MKRLLILVVCLSMFLSPASAHSGGTDSQGGHWNHSTGEYHFHHGRGPHQHPGGVCPYDSSIRTTAKKKEASKSKEQKDSSNFNEEKVKNVSLWIMGLVFGVPLAAGCVTSLISSAVKKAKEMKTFTKDKAAYEKLYKERNPIDLVNKPRFTIIGADGLPRQTPSKVGWGELYTVYVTEHGQAYHQRCGCCYATRQMHIYHASKSRRPCKICCRNAPDLTWYEEYLRIRSIKKKYKID